MKQVATYTNSTLQPLYRPNVPMVNVKIAASTTLVAGTILGEITASPGTYAAYNDSNSDGTQVARGILAVPVVTDSSGNMFVAGQASSEVGDSPLGVPMYLGGIFLVGDLTGLDAAAIADLQGHLANGAYNTATAILSIG